MTDYCLCIIALMLTLFCFLGTEMGLTVILDAHTDLVNTFSVSSDFKGFTVAILSEDEFPMTRKNEIQVKPGHLNNLAIMPTKLDSVEAIKRISVNQRDCYFKEETATTKLFKEYSQINCLLECSMSFAQAHLIRNNISNACTPWYLPFVEPSTKVCDPWQKAAYLETMQHSTPQKECSHCRPDCSKVVYQLQISTQEFRACDIKNFGVSKLCSFINTTTKPQKWSKQVIDAALRSNRSEDAKFL